MQLPSRFTCIASEGLGVPSSTIAHSMAYFKGCIYVGVTNPAGSGPDDIPRIWRYHPDSGKWDEVYRPVLVKPDARSDAKDVQLASHGEALGKRMNSNRKKYSQVARDRGFRGMTLFKGKNDPSPCIYASTLSPWGSLILRSEDGEQFEAVSEPGLGRSEVLSFRGLVPFEGRLFVSPAGTNTDQELDRNFTSDVNVYCSDDPRSGRWQQATELGFGDPNNGVIYSLATAHGWLYAGTGNAERGFQVWRTQARGEPPFDWELVIRDGAYRYNFNMATAAMTEFQGALYVGGGIPGFGYDKANDVGPAAAELIRIFPDGRWDLLCGTPRFTPDGFKVPLSARGPGLDDPFNSVIWSMTTHRNTLFMGTHQWEPFDCIKPGRSGSLRGGYQLWASNDGEHWKCLTRDAFGDPFATGLRTLLSTPHGLVAGTSNHKPLLEKLARVAGHNTQRPGKGGFEVWLGQ